MPRIIPAAIAVLIATVATQGVATQGAAAQEAAAPQDPPSVTHPVEDFDAAAYVRGLLANDRYDPRDRERALNGAPEIETHWRKTIFDGRRTRATPGTGITLPDLVEPEE